MQRLTLILVAIACWLCPSSPAVAQGKSSGTDSPLIRADILDPAAFAQWVDGRETPVPEARAKNGPCDVVWTRDARVDWRGVDFGESRSPGVRHLRIGLKDALPVGAVLVRGGGRLSVLRSDKAVKYPGDLTQDAQWLPAERIKNRRVSRDEVGREEYAVWLLPPRTKTQALRFTHEGQAADRDPNGWLGGVCIMPLRLANLAPQAVATSSARPEAAGRLIDESNNGTWETWSNGEKGAEQPISTANSEWLMLTWPKPVKLTGACLLWTGFASAEIEAFHGSADESPAGAPPARWRKVATVSQLEPWYPLPLGPNWVKFSPLTVETRSLRVRITAPPQSEHSHLAETVKQQRKVWLGELMAFSPLGSATLESAILAHAEESSPPIAVKFTLPEPGLVTLVIEDAGGMRIRNLVSETPFPAGKNVAWWDGSDDLERDIDASTHGLYHLPTKFVAPSNYTVRGLWRKSLKLVYEMSVYSPGRPPWETADGTGCWMTNHTPPTSLAFVPGSRTSNGKPLIFIGAFVAEGGHGLQWVREDGEKVGGQGWIGGNWTGAPTLAVDAGPKAVAEDLCYAASVWEGELRVTAKTRTLQDKPILKLKLGEDPAPQTLEQQKRPQVLAGFDGGDRHFVLAGIAARDGFLVCSLVRQKELLLIDLKTGKLAGKASVENPRGVAFDREGRLLVLSGSKLLRLTPINSDQPQIAVTSPQVVIAKGLEDPRQLTVDVDGRIFIADRGRSHQVKVFAADGRFERGIGQPGGPSVGPYDPLRMVHPNGLAIDSQGRVWVAEDDFRPKRTSVWSPSGELLQAYYGPSEYGGGGVLDPRDKSKFFYKGLEFQLDWQTGRDKLVRVFFRPDETLQAHYGSYSPDTPLYPEARRGERYFTSCYTNNPTNGSSAAFLWQDESRSARLVAAIGSAHDWNVLLTEPFRARWPAGVDPRGDRWKNAAVFSWTDLNGDVLPQPNEVQMVKVESGGVTVMNDLSVVFAQFDGRAVRLAVKSFTEKGAPQYDLASPETLVEGAQRPVSSGGDQALTEETGWTILTSAPKPYSNYGLGGAFRGQPRWSYPSPWPGLHPSHESALPDRPGEVVGHTRLLGGWIRPRGEGGPMFCVNGNMGNMYLFTADGLFVGTLFHDIRLRPNWAMPQATRGMDVTDVSLHDENFWPSITQATDGQVYLVDGGRTSLVRIDGLDSIRRLSEQPLRVTDDDLTRARNWFTTAEAVRQSASVREPLRVALRSAAPVVDGQLNDWPDSTQWAVIDRRGLRANFDSNSKPYDVSAAACIAADSLFVAFRTTEKDLLRNSGTTPNALFKTGGCLDVMLATDPQANPKRTKPVPGDLRLLVTQVSGETKAMLYRAVVPGTKEPVAFSSPSRTIVLDVAIDVSSNLKLATNGQGHFEFSIPLAVLGWNPRSGKTFHGDLGLLRGNGFQTQQRVYWSNKATSITSDVPSEAELTPRLWGELRVVESGQ